MAAVNPGSMARVEALDFAVSPCPSGWRGRSSVLVVVSTSAVHHFSQSFRLGPWFSSSAVKAPPLSDR